MQNSWSYGKSIEAFLEDCKEDPNKILGRLNDGASNFCILQTQIEAWKKEIEILQEALKDFSSQKDRIYFEFNLMRYSKRVDVVLILNGILFCLEFKVKTVAEEAKTYQSQDKNQAKAYADEFSQFHSESHKCPIVPMLVVSDASDCADVVEICCDNIFEVIRANASTLSRELKKAVSQLKSLPLGLERLTDLSKWERGEYQTVPTIVQAADRLFENQNVEAITRSGTDVIKTMDVLTKIIRKAESSKSRVICFVTGEPGAGKTLVGLKLAAERMERATPNVHGDSLIRKVFLSGNYPLVKVLKESLVLNFYDRISKCEEWLNKEGNELTTVQEELLEQCGFVAKKDVSKRGKVKYVLQTIEEFTEKGKRRKEVGAGAQQEFKRRKFTKNFVISVVSSMIQLVSHFRRGLEFSENPPSENVFIFDEAQRAWSADQIKQKDKKTHPMQIQNGWSEPRALLEYLNRHGEGDWCVAVALVGTGQDIHAGEAGIEEWYKALADGENSLVNWKICAADQLSKTAAFKATFEGKMDRLNPWPELSYEHLHLFETMRSFKAKDVGALVNAILNGANGVNKARELLGRIKEFPIYLTRDIEQAKTWIRKVSLGGSRTCGMMISSRAVRLRHYGFFTQAQSFDEVAWFLKDVEHINSSSALEVTASEFKVQGLELDYTLVGWDGDFVYDEASGKFLTRHFALKNNCWKEVKKINEGEETGTNEEPVDVDPKDKDRHLRNAYRVLLTRARQGMIIFIPEGDKNNEFSNLAAKNYDPTYKFLHDEIGIPDLDD